VRFSWQLCLGSLACLILAAIFAARQQAAEQLDIPPRPKQIAGDGPQPKPKPGEPAPARPNPAVDQLQGPFVPRGLSLVPGFGVPLDPSAPRVEGFGSSIGSISSLPIMMSEDEIRNFVRNLIDKYDTNHDGILERDEGEWKDMKTEFKAADTNNDDNATFDELVSWLVEYNRNRALNSGGVPLSALPPNATAAQLRAHAMTLMNLYDKNKSGALERDEGEWKDIKPEMKAADQDKNDIITIDELINWLAIDNRKSSTQSIPAGNPLSVFPVNADSAQIAEFAQKLMTLYDRNKSGALERDAGEWANMKNELKSVDKDSNDIVTLEEMIAWLTQYNHDRMALLDGNPLSFLPANADQNQIREFAKNLIAVMDKNKSNALERDSGEWANLPKEMRAADKDGNDVITLDELVNWITQNSKNRSGASSSAPKTTGTASSTGTVTTSGTSAAKGAVASNATSRISGIGASGSTAYDIKAPPPNPAYPLTWTPQDRLPPGLPKWFLEKDTNKNGTVELAEYLDDEFTEEKLVEFQKYDINRDYVITPQEVLKVEGKRPTVPATNNAEIQTAKNAAIQMIRNAEESLAKIAPDEDQKKAEKEAKKQRDEAAKKAKEAAKQEKGEPPPKKERPEPPPKKEKDEPPL
jgi:Ca2+-binding EF-hand superfamily protein